MTQPLMTSYTSEGVRARTLDAAQLPPLYASEISGGGLILRFEIEFDLDVIRVAEENLPTGTIRHLVDVMGHALAGEVLPRRIEAAAAECNVIDDAGIGLLFVGF